MEVQRKSDHVQHNNHSNYFTSERSGLLHKNLLTKTLSYKLVEHRKQVLQKSDAFARDLSSATLESLSEDDSDLNGSNLFNDECRPTHDTKQSQATTKCDPNGNCQNRQNHLSLPLLKKDAVQINSPPVEFNGQSPKETQCYNKETLMDVSGKIQVIDRQGLYEPARSYAARRHQSNLISRCDNGPQYRTYLLIGDSIKEIKPLYNRKNHTRISLPGAIDKRKKFEENNKFQDRMHNQLPRHPKPSQADALNSIGLTLKHAALKTDQMKKSDRKPFWSWLVVQDESKNNIEKGQHVKSHGIDSRITHYRDLHPVSTAMFSHGTNTSSVKWTVPSSKPLDVTKLIMERLQLIKKPDDGLLYND